MDKEGGSAKKAPTTAPRRVFAGADAFGSDLKDTLVKYLKEKDVEVVDLGVDKYYSVAVKVASQLAKEKKSWPEVPLSRGLLICGTGVGVSIFANKFGGVYAAPCNSVNEAVNARSINNTNVLTLGAKIASPEEGKKILDAWLDTPFKAPCPASDGCPWTAEIEQFLDASIEEADRISHAALQKGDIPLAEGEGVEITSPTDTGILEKDSAASKSHVDFLDKILESTDLSPSVNGEPTLDSLERAGVGPGLTAVHAPISQLSTVSTAGLKDFELPSTAVVTEPEEKSEERGTEVDDKGDDNKPKHGCAICALATERDFETVEIMPGGSWKIVREDPTSAVVRFKAGSVEPAHHHTFGHDLIVTSGKKTVWNLTTNERFDLTSQDFLYTPAGDVHRVQYHEDTEFFIRWDGHWDIILDEDVETAKAALEKPRS